MKKVKKSMWLLLILVITMFVAKSQVQVQYEVLRTPEHTTVMYESDTISHIPSNLLEEFNKNGICVRETAQLSPKNTWYTKILRVTYEVWIQTPCGIVYYKHVYTKSNTTPWGYSAIVVMSILMFIFTQTFIKTQTLKK